MQETVFTVRLPDIFQKAAPHEQQQTQQDSNDKDNCPLP
jgi:hypothetical protein